MHLGWAVKINSTPLVFITVENHVGQTRYGMESWKLAGRTICTKGTFGFLP